jgi:anti-anti-sigma regulatory factor
VLFDVQVGDRDGWQVASVVGDVDLSSLTRLLPPVGRLDGPRVAIDLTSVDFLDPVCLGVLVAAGLRARRRSARLVVVAAGDTAALLTESRIDQVVDVVASLPAP